MTDVLVDNCIAKNFCNPMDPHYKTFIGWLRASGTLVVTQRLLNEYCASTASSASTTNICALVGFLQQHGRLSLMKKSRLETLVFDKAAKRKLRSNKEDHDSIKAVLMSTRKFALSLDRNFQYDINNFPGHTARAESRPENLPYA